MIEELKLSEGNMMHKYDTSIILFKTVGQYKMSIEIQICIKEIIKHSKYMLQLINICLQNILLSKITY